MTRQVTLLVNDVSINLDYFVQGFIDHTVAGMLAGLEGTGEIETLDISIEGGEVGINLNNATVPINLFASKIVRNTIVGMVSALKGVGQVDRINISTRR